MNIWKIFQTLLPKEKKLPEKMSATQVDEMIAEGKVILVREKKIFDRYPDHVVEKIRSFSDVELLEVLKNDLENLVVAEESYVYNLRVIEGEPHYSCGTFPDVQRLDGLVQFLTVPLFNQPDDYEIWLAVELIRQCVGVPTLIASVSARNIDSVPLELNEYNECLSCRDWGCWECNFNGGGGGWGR